MSKLGQIIKKNLLLLFRSKSSAFVILFGPLFIILLIGLAFTNSASYDLKIGYHAPEGSELTARFVENMEESGFVVDSYGSIEECVETIKQGSTQTCILFPEDFRIANNKTNEITFYVDQSRTNFVYQIIDTVSSNLGVESAELSKDLTNSILDVLWQTERGIDNALAETIRIKAAAATAAGRAEEAAGTAEGMDLAEANVDTSDAEDYFESLENELFDLETTSGGVLADGRALESELEGVPYDTVAFISFQEALDGLEEALDQTEIDRAAAVKLFSEAVDELDRSLDDLNGRLGEAREVNLETIGQIGGIKEKVEEMQKDLDGLKRDLEGLGGTIDSLKVTSSETISNPITTTIEYISSKTSKLSYMFPYLIMLVVMFIGLLLSSTLIIMEKTSKSSFRTFCTPISEELLMIGNFTTSFLIVLVQLVIISGIAYFFMRSSLVSNIGVSLLLLFLGVVFFILLGMAIGYSLNSQEAVTMIAISIGSIFLFISNLILPLETLSQQLQLIIRGFNPYVISSEALRKALLFNAPLSQLSPEIITLLSYSAIVFVLMVVARDLMRSRVYLNFSSRRHRLLLEDPRDLYLKVGGKELKGLDDLRSWLEGVDEETFRQELPWKKLRSWLIKNQKPKWLRVKLAGKNRKHAIAILSKLSEKHK
ncbi:ABC transporter permease [Candidatus Woesearchaeota archaeon]|nr:ABC transporter permease [Candidatus Woesearchaeota archaeon]